MRALVASLLLVCSAAWAVPTHQSTNPATGESVTLHSERADCPNGWQRAEWRSADKKEIVRGCWRKVEMRGEEWAVLVYADGDRGAVRWASFAPVS